VIQKNCVFQPIALFFRRFAVFKKLAVCSWQLAVMIGPLFAANCQPVTANFLPGYEL
jgi:hypothetical protein